MAKYEILNQKNHQDLKVLDGFSSKFNHNVMYAKTFPIEFRDIQTHYPILFRKSEMTGHFQPVCLFGIESGENLFLDEKMQSWTCPYIPLMIQRGPFMIGKQIKSDGPEQEVVTVDVTNPVCNSDMGQAVFLENGEPSEYLKKISSILQQTDEGDRQNEILVKLLLDLDLLESLKLNITLDSGKSGQMVDFYTVNEDKLLGLASEKLGLLNEKGALLPIYMIVASLSNVSKLIDRKNKLEAL